MISKDEYMTYVKEENDRLEMLNAQKSSLEEQLARQKKEPSCRWAETFAEYMKIGKLTREVVLEMIDRIEVHENSEIDLYLRFCN